jgi:hypothetical protein
MRNFTNQYKQILTPEVRVSRAEILPRNIYRISTYKDGVPPTKVGLESRYVFVIGKLEGKIHCLLLTHILPDNFLSLLNRLRNKKIPIEKDQPLSELLKLLPKDGRQLFESYIKNNSKVYLPIMDNYRTYFLNKIQNVWEIRFEEGFLQKVFKEGNTASTRHTDIKKEINENDG